MSFIRFSHVILYFIIKIKNMKILNNILTVEIPLGIAIPFLAAFAFMVTIYIIIDNIPEEENTVILPSNI